jgi:predicted protein tyrosine phosphatase
MKPLVKIEYDPIRIGNVHNAHQNFAEYPRTLCVCTGGLLRSPTLAWLLSNPPYNRNTRAAGSAPEHSLVIVDEVLIEWADELVFVNPENAAKVAAQFFAANFKLGRGKKCYVLDVPDHYGYRDPRLVTLLERALADVGFPAAP